ncbi:MAG: PAS domain S-box protein [Chloroflexi bacterium]|nr:PAS domain S-box protein [Chloroflexota bacterium]
MIEELANPDDAMRRQAEAAAAVALPQIPTDPAALSPETLYQLLHELQTNQMELQLQNEELRRTQMELDQSRARYAELYDLAPIGYVSLSEQGVILEVNLTFANLLGVARESLEQRPFSQLILPADQHIYFQHSRQFFTTATPQVCELRLARANSDFFWARLEGVQAQSADGALICRVVISDITTHRQAEQAQRESEDLFGEFLQHSPIYVFFKDQEIRAVKLSQNYEHLLGKPISELLGKTMDELFPSALAKSMVADDLRVLHGGKQIEVEEELNGRYYSTVKFPIYRDGQPRYLAGFTKDITEHKLAEWAIQRSEKRLKEAEAVAHVGYGEMDLISGKTFWSEEIFRIFGLDPAGDPPPITEYPSLIHPEDVDGLFATFAACVHTQQPYDLIYRIYHSSGEIRTVHSVGYLETNPTDGSIKLFGTLHDITAQKRSEMALEQSEKRFRALIENAPDGINLISADGQLTYASPAALRILGYTADDVQNTNMAALTHPEDLPSLFPLLADLIHHPGKVITTEYRFHHKEGDWRWLESTITNLLAEPGIEAILFNFRDITRRKQAEETAQQQREQMQFLYSASQRLNRTLDLDEIYRTIFDFLTAVVPCDSLLISAFDPQTGLITCRAHWLEQGIRKDVSQYPPIPLEAEDQGTQSRVIRTGRAMVVNDYQALLKNTQAIYYINDDTNEVLVEADPEEEAARSALIVPIKIGEQVIGVVQVTSYRLNAYTENHLQFVEALTLHINSAQTNALLYAQVQNELNERKQAEEALQRSYGRLENVLDELRQTQAQLIQQERLAAVGQLAAGIAHDFNNILAVIALFVEMSLDTPDLSPQLHQRLETISYQAKRAAHLVQQILDFGRRAILQPDSLSLTLFLQEQVELWRRTIPESIKIHFDAGAADCVIHADATRIQQMFTNLVLNARDAMPQGGDLRVSLAQVRLSDQDAASMAGMPGVGDNWVQIIVSDTGTGIAPTILPRIFEPFFTTKEPGLGSGLGLAQVYGIVKQHQGHIDVRTEEGQGTTFIIYLPGLAVAAQKETAVPTTKPLQGQGETILVVEDNPDLREALTSVLNLLNYETLAAANGREALAILEQQSVALVLSDLIMPEMGGKELLQALRQRELNLPVIILSGHPLETERQTLQNEGIADWLTKPLDMNDLSLSLARALRADEKL